MLGERIRKLRKQKNLTLEALAGKGLTKGMLSLIENNKANPSMESLSYIADQLGVEVAELLGDISSEEIRAVLEQAEKLFNMNSEKRDEKIFEEIVSIIRPYIPSLNQGYESARLLEIYSRTLFYQKKEGWEELSVRSSKMYDQLNLIAKRASIGIFRAMARFVEHQYELALEIFKKERADIEDKQSLIDPITRLDLDYHEAILHFSAGDSRSGIQVMEQAIAFSKEQKIFYLVSDLYRLAAAYAMLEQDEEEMEYYIKKLRQYGEFAEDLHSLLFCELIDLVYLNNEQQNFEEALQVIEKHLGNPKMMEDYKYWIYLEKGKALYGLGRYHESLQWFEKVEIPAYLHFPIDLAFFYVMHAYQSLCYYELGENEKAAEFAEKARDLFKSLPQSPQKEFAEKAYRKVIKCQDKGDTEY
ncbi:helix-turn-helix domain-containing protein [Bacillus litorisediminis]|uniref:helix-turn-helix domain-containing protein n=1 Tax=Bacillus litorisediminis TaxID=2922713 RepID=UPI001FB005BE|nr:helix-turn-helix transcriptional regulator [Bacillus litorisediminis]